VALSGLAADPVDPDTLYTVSDSFLAQSYVYTIANADTPATITSRIAVGGADGAFDLEGIAVAPEGGFWLASEGRANGARANEIVKIAADGTIQSRVELPPGLVANATNNGFEGVAVTGSDASEFVYVVVQREWDDDPQGQVKIGRYEVGTGAWTFVRYPLDALASPPDGAWVGLSEITLLPGGRFAIIERDNQLGTNARIKRIYEVELAGADFRPWDDARGLITVEKGLLRDVLGVLETNSIWTPDKLEGLGVNAAGEAWLLTDNDGLDDALGQTVFVGIGSL
jgi:hypothetical protein